MSSALGSPNVSNNLVQGNFIGTDVTGTAALGNGQDGVGIYGLNNAVGGSIPGARNIISGNGRYGVHIFSGDGSVVQGNYIGTDISGTLPIGNRATGATVTAHRVKVGGQNPGEGNTIAFNGINPVIHAGVAVVGNARQNSISRNSIFSNVGLGIDLGGGSGPDGVTPNDPCDADTLVPNHYQNHPVLISAQPSGSNTVIAGILDSKPSQSYRIEFFASPERDSTEHGEGKMFLGSTDVFTEANCVDSFSVTLPVSVPNGSYITATATDTAGNTSEFSASIAAGTTEVHPASDGIPTEFVLEQNYPNPFNPVTHFGFRIAEFRFVSLKVYDLLGREVATLVNEVKAPGTYKVAWDARQTNGRQATGVASGVYIYRMKAGTFAGTRKMVFLR
jgi:hypothetical protein